MLVVKVCSKMVIVIFNEVCSSMSLWFLWFVRFFYIGEMIVEIRKVMLKVSFDYIDSVLCEVMLSWEMQRGKKGRI